MLQNNLKRHENSVAKYNSVSTFERKINEIVLSMKVFCNVKSLRFTIFDLVCRVGNTE